MSDGASWRRYLLAWLATITTNISKQQKQENLPLIMLAHPMGFQGRQKGPHTGLGDREILADSGA